MSCLLLRTVLILILTPSPKKKKSDIAYLMRSVKSVVMKEDLNRLLAFLGGFVVVRRAQFADTESSSKDLAEMKGGARTMHPFFKAGCTDVLMLIREMMY